MNFFAATVESMAGGLSFQAETFAFPVPADWQQALAGHQGRKVVFGIRPEDLGSPKAEETPGQPKITATVEVIEPMGSETYLYLKTGATSFIARVDAHRKCEVGHQLALSVLLSEAHVFDQETEAILA